MSATQIRPFTDADVIEAARLHMEAFPGFFLSTLGERFLREFYLGFLDSGAVGFTARTPSGQLEGVVVGHCAPGMFFRRLLVRRWHAFAWASLALVVRRPMALPRLVRALGYRGQTPIVLEGALLSSICVDPAQHGRGVGRRLINAWVSELRRRGLTEAYLTTDAIDNEATNAFYESVGWVQEGTYRTPEGRLMNCYAWKEAAA